MSWLKSPSSSSTELFHFLSDCGWASLSKQPFCNDPHFLSAGVLLSGRLANSPACTNLSTELSLRITLEPCAKALAKLSANSEGTHAHFRSIFKVPAGGWQISSVLRHRLQPASILVPHLLFAILAV